MLPKRKRVGKGRFPSVWRAGSSLSSPHLLLKTTKVEGEGGFSVVAQKSAGAKASKRNRLRRQGYSILSRHSKNKVLTSASIVFIRKNAPFTVLEEELSSLLARAGLI